MSRLRALSLVVGLGLLAPFAARADDDVIPVYVDQVAVEKGLTVDGRALTSTLCSALAKEKGLEVMCAPDVEQLVAFSGQLALMGKSSPTLEKLEKQMARVRVVVRGELRKGEGGGLAFHVGVHDKVDGDTGGIVLPGERRSVIREPIPDGKATRLLDRMPALAKQAAAHVRASVAPPPPPKLQGK